ncbi:hypothetical protein B0H14DRAFT_3461062 [Mycena olivaceomarginata]|nr:hypothetical protein B0H14DRAFT_3461062 [Mycena olivaceomarginata]
MPIAPSGSVFSISVLLYSAESVVLLVPLAVQRRGFPDAVTVPAPKSPLLDVTPSPALPQSVLHSPKAPEYSSTSFTSNGVRRPAPPLAKPFHDSDRLPNRGPYPRLPLLNNIALMGGHPDHEDPVLRHRRHHPDCRPPHPSNSTPALLHSSLGPGDDDRRTIESFPEDANRRAIESPRGDKSRA